MTPEEINAQVAASLAEYKPSLKAGGKSSEFLLIVGVGLAALVNPFMKKYLGVEIDASQFAYLAGLAGTYLASRVGLKFFK